MEDINWEAEAAEISKYVDNMVKVMAKNPVGSNVTVNIVDECFRRFMLWLRRAELLEADPTEVRIAVIYLINIIILATASRISNDEDGGQIPSEKWIARLIEDLTEELRIDFEEARRREEQTKQ